MTCDVLAGCGAATTDSQAGQKGQRRGGAVRALNTIGPRRPRIAFATSRKGPQARHLSLHPTPGNTQPVLWQGIPVGETPRKGGVWGKDGQLTAPAPATPTAALSNTSAPHPQMRAVKDLAFSGPQAYPVALPHFLGDLRFL